MVKSYQIAFKTWAITALLLSLALLAFFLSMPTRPDTPLFLIPLVTYIASIPALIALLTALYVITRFFKTYSAREIALHTVHLLCALPYGVILAVILVGVNGLGHEKLPLMALACVLTIFVCAYLSTVFLKRDINLLFTIPNQTPNMDNIQSEGTIPEIPSINSESNKIMLKGILTVILIICLMIPTMLINNLVQERQARQEQITTEVSSKWASAQTLAGPFINLPYRKSSVDQYGKNVIEDQNIMILPENLSVNGKIDHELRQRSIYKVLLYRADLLNNGDIVLHLPKEIDPASVQWQSAKICYVLSDFKGIEEKLVVNLNGVNYELSPGLPKSSGLKGLSATIALSAADLEKSIPFKANIKLKGSQQLHFLPLAGNSTFSVQSTWPNPSFDGSVLPTERQVAETGFSAKWKFNKANLPFPTYLSEMQDDLSSLAFGVTMLQPADGYSKTNRCVKYGILFIGLTLSLFFVIELMQKKPLHPVQYALIGFALVIFYTLLLSISEFLMFDYAYAIAAVATISLISIYAKSHFGSVKSMLLFGSVLTVLYGFIFVLIQLEDTALLIGSIGLFAILALIMFASRRINWYGKNSPAPAFQ